MSVTKYDILRLIDDLSETELRILYTFIEEFRIAEAERAHDQHTGTDLQSFER